uniref:heme oxygenase (biliverdin-producing) n=1 Tax=Myripristis murdjan TaxID=586833 RepID=A0A667XDQ3_9TELE
LPPFMLLVSTLPPPSPTDLSEMLAEGTKESHDRAENCHFVKDFLRGRIKRELFKRGTMALYYVYSAMEEEIENRDHPQLAPIYFPTELHRREALARDLEYFYGDDWQEQISLSPGTKPYVDRTHDVGERDPVLLVAHSYTRSMGDLSGGQILKKVAQQALKLPATGEGLNFYQFEGIHSHKGFKQLYRSRINELELDAETKEKLVANLAFGFNMMDLGLWCFSGMLYLMIVENCAMDFISNMTLMIIHFTHMSLLILVMNEYQTR